VESHWKNCLAKLGKRFHGFYLTGVQIEDLKSKKLLKFVSFGLEIRFPGGKAKDVGADFRIAVLKRNDLIGSGEEGKVVWVVDTEQAWVGHNNLVHDWGTLPKALTWDAPTADKANFDMQDDDFEDSLSILIIFEMLRTAPLPEETTVAQFRGVWNFTHAC
jgi:hypothetical protein